MKIRIHPLFLLLLVLAGLTGAGRLFLLNFISVVLHEMAHAVVAWAFSYHTYRIELYPFGGVALMDSALMGDGLAEAVTALAGPVHSLLFAVLSYYGGNWLGGHTVGFELARINLWLGLFNLLPFYPLDGGRILRALLIPVLGLRVASRWTSVATRWTAGIGLFPAVFLLCSGRLPWSVPLVLAFLFWAARDGGDYLYLRWRQGEKRRKSLLEGRRVPVTVQAVDEGTPLERMGDALDGRAFKVFLTTDGAGRVNGWIDETRIWEAFMTSDYRHGLTLAKIKSRLAKEEFLLPSSKKEKIQEEEVTLFPIGK